MAYQSHQQLCSTWTYVALKVQTRTDRTDMLRRRFTSHKCCWNNAEVTFPRQCSLGGKWLFWVFSHFKCYKLTVKLCPWCFTDPGSAEYLCILERQQMLIWCIYALCVTVCQLPTVASGFGAQCCPWPVPQIGGALGVAPVPLLYLPNSIMYEILDCVSTGLKKNKTQSSEI